MERTSRMGTKFNLTVIVICIIYLGLRFSFPETIEFGYDQPRLATRVIEFIENGKFFETQKFAERAPWGNISWGPALFYFYAPFLIFLKNPVIVSNIIAIFNMLSVICVTFLAAKYFSKTTGVIAGLLLATHPWWYVFSRMIYQPTPVVTIISLSMFLFFISINKPKSIWLSLLIFSWVFLIELYSHTLSFVVISFLAIIITKQKDLFNKFTILGVVASLLLIIPYFTKFNFREYLPSEAVVSGRLANSNTIKITDAVTGLFKFISGDNFEYQLGYGYENFITENPITSKITRIILILNILVVFYVFLSFIFVKEKRFFKLMLISWLLSPILFLTVIKLPYLLPLPRYFLISLPPFVIIWGIFISEVTIYLKNKLILLLPLLVVVYWCSFVFKYEKFIKSYSFPNGHLSTYADTQYYYVLNSIKLALNDSSTKGYKQTVISNDESRPKEFSLEWGMTYILKYVLHLNQNINPDLPTAYYLIDYSVDKVNSQFTKIGKSGPITVYQFKN